MKHRWISYFQTLDDSGYLDQEGRDVEESDAVEFIGTNDEAHAESDRRADLYERQTNAFVTRVTYESKGVIQP